MKKSLIRNLVFGSAAVAGVFLFAQTASAAIGGRCDNCHTMHNSQDGESMTSNAGGGTTANEYLLLLDCVGCHSRNDGLSATQDDTNAPAVDHTNVPLTTPGTNYFNAGGSFFWVRTVGDQYGHNVDEVTSGDLALSDTPPGDSTAAYDTGTQISCADAGGAQFTGCHYSGGHHANTGGDYLGDLEDGSIIARYVGGSSVGDSYRFLSGGTYGGEDSDWEWSNSLTDHNVYSGDSDITGAASGTITQVCIRCHGDFHGTYAVDVGTGTGPANPWYRHPTDIGLRDSNVDSEHASYSSYAPVTPIAMDVTAIIKIADQPVVPADFDNISDSASFDRVTCVSCHRAHGSVNSDMLRWSYADMIAGAGAGASKTGCFKCHNDKD